MRACEIAVSPDKAVELQIGEISKEISVDDLCLIIRDNTRPWNWGVNKQFYFWEPPRLAAQRALGNFFVRRPIHVLAVPSD